MTVNILERWKKVHNTLPKTIFYYRALALKIKERSRDGTDIPLRDGGYPAGDGVSDGQFVNVLTRELNLLEYGFKQIDATYNPQLVIVVGQCPVS